MLETAVMLNVVLLYLVNSLNFDIPAVSSTFWKNVLETAVMLNVGFFFDNCTLRRGSDGSENT